MKTLLISALALSLPLHADEVRDIISQAESTAAQSASGATELIDRLQRRAASERGTDAHRREELSSSSWPLRDVQAATAPKPHNQSRSTARPFPKQETVKDVPLPHTGKEGCYDKQAGGGRCASTLLNQVKPQGPLNAPQLLIFVSQSMPKESLKSLWREAHKVGGKLLFRGLIGGSFKQTQAFMKELEIVADIDPTKFEEHAIKAVPTFMLITKENTDRLSGNVSLQSFLTEAQEKGDTRTGSRLIVMETSKGDLT